MTDTALIRRVGVDLSHEVGPREDMVVTLECVTPSGDHCWLPLSADCALALLNRLRIFERQYHRTNRRNAPPAQAALVALSEPMDGDAPDEVVTRPRLAAS